MFGKNKDHICVSFADECLKIVHFRATSTEKQIIAALKKSVHGVASEELPAIVRTMISELGLNKPTAVYALSANSATTKNIEVPSVDPTEIKSIIDLQAGRHTPYSREEILIGYINIGVFQRNYTKVLLVIVNREQLLKQTGIFTQAGVRIEKIIFAPEASAQFYAKILKIKDDDLPVGIIDVSYDTTDFMVQASKTIVASRSIPVGMDHLIKEGKPAQDKLLAELGQSVEVYQNEDIGKIPSQYLVTCDDAKLQEMLAMLRDKLKTNVTIMPFLDHVSAGQPVLLKMVSEYNDDSFLSVMTSAIMLDSLQLDLTPDEIRTQRAIEEKGRQIIFLGIYGLIILVLVCAISFAKIYFRGVYLEKLKEDYATKQRTVDYLDRIAQKTQILKSYTGERLVTLETLKTLYDLVPEEMYLQSISFEDNGTISIQGVSESMSRVFNLVTALEESVLFKGVKTKSTSTKQERGKDVAVFELTFRLESAPDEEEKKEQEEGEKDAKGSNKEADKPKKEEKPK